MYSSWALFENWSADSKQEKNYSEDGCDLVEEIFERDPFHRKLIPEIISSKNPCDRNTWGEYLPKQNAVKFSREKSKTLPLRRPILIFKTRKIGAHQFLITDRTTIPERPDRVFMAKM